MKPLTKNKLRIHWRWLKNQSYEEVIKFIEKCETVKTPAEMNELRDRLKKKNMLFKKT